MAEEVIEGIINVINAEKLDTFKKIVEIEEDHQDLDPTEEEDLEAETTQEATLNLDQDLKKERRDIVQAQAEARGETQSKKRKSKE